MRNGNYMNWVIFILFIKKNVWLASELQHFYKYSLFDGF